MKITIFKRIKNYILKKLNESLNINYIFYSFFILAITFFSSFKSNILFTLYSFIQTCLLTIFLVFLHHNIKFKVSKKIFISIIFFTLLFYAANFILLGLMDSNFMFAIKIFFSGGLENILIAFRALNLNFPLVIGIFLTIIFIPLIGLYLYKLSHRLSKKKPLILKQKHLFSFFVSFLILLFSIDLTCRFKEIDYITKNHHKLPLFYNCISNNKQKIILSNPLKNLRNENKILEEITNKNISIDNKPNIFIFVVEALRKDYITKEITSNIYNFKEENISSETSFSSSNATQISWYSIFHSNYPFFWSTANKTAKHGSIPLNILKKLGYKINVFSSAEMTYFHMDQLLFGKDNYLIDSLNDFSSSSNDSSYRDNLTIESLKQKLNDKKNKTGNVFLVFLDSTHSEYSWPKNFKPKFYPFADKINYITLSQSKKDLELIKNRYKNALNYIDHLFSDFLSTLKKNNLFNDSIIVLTGDHGEEFFEDKSIFHASHLNDYQINVPIIFKLLNNNQKCTKPISHINIFPTILNELLPNENFHEYFDGKSIFSKDIHPYVISVNQNGNFTPNELLIRKDQIKIHGKILNEKKPSFEIDETKNITAENIENTIKNALEDIIN